MHKERGLPLYMAFIDVRKAYDRVWRPGLWYKLGLSPRFLRLLQTMYKSVARSVQGNSQLTSRFNVDLGVPQGAVLSPTLYALYIDGLHQALRRSGLGVWVAGRLVPLLMYADDIVLLASNPGQLHAMLCVLGDYATTWRFDIKYSATVLLNDGKYNGFEVPMGKMLCIALAVENDSIPSPFLNLPAKAEELNRLLPQYPLTIFKVRVLNIGSTRKFSS